MSWLKSVGVECMQHNGVLSYYPNRYLTAPSTSSAGSLLLKTHVLAAMHAFSRKEHRIGVVGFRMQGVSHDDMH